MTDIDRAINLSNELYDLITSLSSDADDIMERIGKHHPQYHIVSRTQETLFQIIDLLDDVDAKLHDLDREEVIL